MRSRNLINPIHFKDNGINSINIAFAGPSVRQISFELQTRKLHRIPTVYFVVQQRFRGYQGRGQFTGGKFPIGY